MKSFNTYYTTSYNLINFIDENKIDKSASMLLQVFTGHTSKTYIQNLLKTLNEMFPHATIIGSTTDGEIIGGKVSEGNTVLTFSIFENTSLESMAIEHRENGYYSGQDIAKKLVKKDTKVIITFASGLNTSGEEYLNGITSIDKDVVISGGLAGDNAEFKKTYVFTNDKIIDFGAVAVALNSEQLNVYTDYAYNWQKVGVELKVTKAIANRVYTIEGRKAYDIYEHYLGEKIAKRLPESGTEFPLVLSRNGINISRAVMKVEDDGSLIFAGNISNGDIVQFGYGDLKEISHRSEELAKKVSYEPAESIFVYSCMARRHYLDKEIESEIFPFESVAPTSGFFTYGEFYTSTRKELLNQTMTLLVLSESASVKQVAKREIKNKHENSLFTSINALAHLAIVASKELNQKTNESKIQKEKLYNHAYYDTLTGLANRTLFKDLLSHAINVEKGNNQKFALVFLDIDNFKLINESLGHDIGDCLLKELSSRLLQISLDDNTVARFGGDEFAILIENIIDIEEVMIYTKKILSLSEKPIIINEHELDISVSMGISIFPDDGTSTVDLLKYADVAMYKAKELGKNNAQLYSSEMTNILLNSINLDRELRKSILNEEFEVFYQPKVSILNKNVKGLEALVRWTHPTKGIVFPDVFIPYSQKSGLIIEIDEIVMNKAMKQFSQWYKCGLNPGMLSLNLAIKNLESENFFTTLENSMAKYSFSPKWLMFELLESDIMKNPNDNILKLQHLSNMGISLAIDDFGTGQSSLSYLKKFPLDELKIDKSFIDDIVDDEDDKVIAQVVIALGKALNLDVIAEGVESYEQMRFLVDNGCTNIQGYYYSKPLNSIDVELFIKNFSCEQ